MRYISTTLILLFMAFHGRGQITITDADMPQPGDTIRVSVTGSILDFSPTGNDTTWDFTGLTPVIQRLDTFITVQQTPMLYWFIFTPGVTANMAARNTTFPAIPSGLAVVSNNYTFYKNSTSAFSDVGLALMLSGFPLMVKYDGPDKYYEFPCTAGSSWSSVAFSSATLPGLGFYKTKRTRESQVDGYGTVKTPMGSFAAIRVKSHLLEEDSIHIDSLNMGIPMTIESTEYKWLAKDKGIPVLSAVQTGLAVTVTYQDIFRPLGIAENSIRTLSAWPNPSDGSFTVSLPSQENKMKLEVFSSDGKLILEKDITLNSGVSEKITVNGSGMVFLRLTGKQQVYTGKILIRSSN
jgi:hypothetical protein